MTFTWFYPSQAQKSLDPSKDCHGANTRVGCTEARKVSLHCTCHCNLLNDFVPDVVMVVDLRMFILDRPSLRGMAKDSSIVDFSTAVKHEEGVHLNPSANAVETWLRGWVRLPTRAGPTAFQRVPTWGARAIKRRSYSRESWRKRSVPAIDKWAICTS